MNDEPNDWEMEEENPPDKLKHKWEKEESTSPVPVRCSVCKKFSPAENLTCLYCGAAIGEAKIGLLSKILFWFKNLF